MSLRISNRSRRAVVLLLACGGLPAATNAKDTNWTGGSGNWTDSTHWTSGVPAAGDAAWISSYDSINRTVSYNYAGPDIQLSQIWVEQGGTGTNRLSQTANRLLADSIYVGEYDSGSFDISGGLLQVSGFELGYYGQGTVSQSGSGTVSVSGNLLMSYKSGSSATYAISGAGALSANNISLGRGGVGVFNQNGGAVTLAGSLLMGEGTSGDATYNFSSGTLNDHGVQVGSNGPGVFNQTGGDHVVAGTINIGSPDAVSSGTYIFSWGNLTATSIVVNRGTFQYNGGALNGPIVNNDNLEATQPFHLPNGLTNRGTLSFQAVLTADGAGLDNDGGYISLSNTTLSGNGPLVNDGTITGRGTIAGSSLFTNNSYLSILYGNLTLTKSGGMVNNGSIEVNSGRTLLINTSAGVTNRGSLQLNNGQVTGTGRLTNSVGGILAGAGGIQSPFRNDVGGTVLCADGSLNIVPSFTNAGTVSMEASSASLIGGAIDNTGTIQGLGSVGSPVTNRGTIEPLGGTLRFNSPLNLASTGLVRVPAGNKLLASAGATPNAGTIALVGGTFDNGTNSLNNTGYITGYGTLAASSMTNAGSMTFTGGLTVVNGPLVNNATKNIRVQYNPAIFTGFVTNNGTFTVTGTTATFAGGSSGTPAPVPDLPIAAPPIPDGGAIAGNGALSLASGASVATSYVRQSTLAIDSSSLVQIRGKSNGGNTSIVNQLAITNNSTLDLANNALIVDYSTSSPLDTIRSYIRSARGAGAWTSPGLGSSAVAADSGNRAIGYGEASEILHLSGAQTASWQGQTADASSVLVRYTVLGDANLDGAVNFADLVAVAQHYDQSGTGIGWSAGDFNYDGTVGFADLVSIAQHYDQALPSSPIAGASADLNADLVAAFASVPEPGGMLALTGALLALGRRRRRDHGRICGQAAFAVSAELRSGAICGSSALSMNPARGAIGQDCGWRFP